MTVHTFCDGCEKLLDTETHYRLSVPQFLSATPTQHDFCFECFAAYSTAVVESRNPKDVK